MAGSRRADDYDYRGPAHGPASPQGHRPSPVYNDRHGPSYDDYDDRYDNGAPPSTDTPQTRQQSQQPYFDPPPRDPRYDATGRAPYSEQQEPRSGDYGSTAEEQYDKRPYAPSEPRPNPGNALAPYDEEKAEAEWRHDYHEQQAQRRAHHDARPRPPPSDYDYDYEDNPRVPRYDSRDRYHSHHPDDGRYDERYVRDYDRHRRQSRGSASMNEKPSQKAGGKDLFGGGEGERGLGATLAGAGGGALLGHEFADGALGTIGGAVAGALAAKVVENVVEKKRMEKQRKRREMPYDRRDLDDARDVKPPARRYNEERGQDDERRYGDQGRYSSIDSRESYSRDEYDDDHVVGRGPPGRRRSTRSRDGF